MKSYLFTIHMWADADSLVEAWEQAKLKIECMEAEEALTNTDRVVLTDDEVDLELDTLEMVAEGYEWTCPLCEELNSEIESVPLVRCKWCQHPFEVDNLEHAYE